MENTHDTTMLVGISKIVDVVAIGVPYGFTNRRICPGFVLRNQTVLLESERTEDGYYIGGAGMDGIYLKTDRLYEPVRDKRGKIHAFRELSRYITRLSADEQQMLYRYTVGGMGMPMERLERLESMDCNDAVRKLVARVRDKLKDIPTLECNRLIADIYAVHDGRAIEAIRQHRKTTQER